MRFRVCATASSSTPKGQGARGAGRGRRGDIQRIEQCLVEPIGRLDLRRVTGIGDLDQAGGRRGGRSGERLRRPPHDPVEPAVRQNPPQKQDDARDAAGRLARSRSRGASRLCDRSRRDLRPQRQSGRLRAPQQLGAAARVWGAGGRSRGAREAVACNGRSVRIAPGSTTIASTPNLADPAPEISDRRLRRSQAISSATSHRRCSRARRPPVRRRRRRAMSPSPP